MTNSMIHDTIISFVNQRLYTCSGIGLGIISSSNKSASPVTELIDKAIVTSVTLTSTLSSNKSNTLCLLCRSILQANTSFSVTLLLL